MANPQKENGYTAIANELIEKIYLCSFNATQLRIVLLIMRYTYGYNRKSYKMSLSFIHNALGGNKRNLQRELQKLIDGNVVLILSEATFDKARELSVNKNYDEWDNLLTQQTAAATTDGEKAATTDGEKAAHIKQNIKQNNTYMGDGEIRTPNTPYRNIVELYNSVCVSLPRVELLTDARKRTVKARYDDFKGDINVFEVIFHKAQASNYLTGKVNGFTASFDWLLAPKNYPKVLEGNYDNRDRPQIYNYGGNHGGDKDGDSL